MNRLIAITAIILVSAGLVSASDVKTYKSTYQKNLEEITLSHGAKMIQLRAVPGCFADSLCGHVHGRRHESGQKPQPHTVRYPSQGVLLWRGLVPLANRRDPGHVEAILPFRSCLPGPVCLGVGGAPWREN